MADSEEHSRSTTIESPARLRTVEGLARSAKGRSLEERQLVECARGLIKARIEVAKHAPPGLFKDTAWDVMLELFVRSEEGGIVYVKQLAIASGQPTASAMRLLDRLEAADMLHRIRDRLDHRRVIVTLAPGGRKMMQAMLRQIADHRPAAVVSAETSSAAPVPFVPRGTGLR
jgi:DNA-binding MarR family transcriptional regulator